MVLQAEGAAVRPFKLMQTFPGQYMTLFILKQQRPLLFLVYAPYADTLVVPPHRDPSCSGTIFSTHVHTLCLRPLVRTPPSFAPPVCTPLHPLFVPLCTPCLYPFAPPVLFACSSPLLLYMVQRYTWYTRIHGTPLYTVHPCAFYTSLYMVHPCIGNAAAI